MNKFLFLTLSFFFTTTFSNAQNPDWSWSYAPLADHGSYSPVGMGISKAGNIYTAGNFISTSGSLTFDSYVLSYNAGNIVVAGYDPYGNLLWARQSGSGGRGIVTSVAVDSAGNVFVAGYFTSPTITFGTTTLNMTAGGHNDGFVAKFDNAGNPIWARDISCANSATVTSVCTDRAGNVAIAGFYYWDVAFGTITLNAPGSTAGNSVFIAKYDPSGTVLWARSGAGHTDQQASGITADAAGNFIVTGYFWRDITFGSLVISTTNIQNTVFIVKYTANGGGVWARSAGGTTADDHGTAIAADSSGNIFITGSFQSSSITFGTNVLNNSGNTDVFLAKYNATGAVQWGVKTGGTGTDDGSAVAVDPSGNVYLAGNYTSSTLTFGSISLANPGGTGFFVAKYNTAGAAQWAKGDYTSTSTYGSAAGLTVNSCSDIFATGSFGGTLTLKPTPALPAPYTTGYVAQIGYLNATVAQSACTGQSTGSASVSEVSPGTPAYTYVWSTGSTSETVTGLTAGTYTVTVTDGRGCVNREYISITNRSLIAASFTATGGSCSGACTGTATVTPTGGVTPYSYLWDATTGGQTTAIASGLCPVSYTVAVTDSLGCSKAFPVHVRPTTAVPTTVFMDNISSADRTTLDAQYSIYNIDVPATILTNSSNPNNWVNPGKTVRVKIKTRNNTSSTVSYLLGYARTNSPYFTISDTTAGITDIAFDSSRWSDDEIEINISDATPAGTTAYMDVVLTDGATNYVNTCIAIPVMPLAAGNQTDTTVTDDHTGNSIGDGNSICDPGETIEFKPLMNSVTNYTTYYPRSRFENADALSYINIWANHTGVSGTVYDTTWWISSFVPSGIMNVHPTRNFVFDYTGTTTQPGFALYNDFTALFRLLPASHMSVFRWQVPFIFNTPVTGVQETLPQDNINVYPNPSTGNITISLPEQIKKAAVNVVDITGRTILQGSYTTHTIDLKLAVPDGVYFVNIIDEATNNRVVKKVVIAK